MTMKNIIHGLAKNTEHWKLDELISYVPNEYSDFERFFCLDRKNAGEFVYSDIPLCAFIGLNRDLRDPLSRDISTEMSWRQAALQLHASEWTDLAVAYLETQMYGREFHQPGARSTLRVSNYGGCVRVDNGTHRLVAAMPLLLSRSSNPIIQKVITDQYEPNNQLIARLLKEVGAGSRIYFEIGCDNKNRMNLLIEEGARRRKLFSVDRVSGAFEPLRPGSNWLARSSDEVLSRNWAPVDQATLQCWANNSWVEDSIKYAETSEPTGHSVYDTCMREWAEHMKRNSTFRSSTQGLLTASCSAAQAKEKRHRPRPT